jgi:hypothetical protein
MRILIIIMTALLVSSCEPTQEEIIAEKKLEQSIKKREAYIDGWIRDSGGKDLVIVKVRNCEYVLWHNNYGSDMEHYEGCQNKEHE